MAMPQAFVKVGQTCSGMNGHTLLAKVLTTKTVRRKGHAVEVARQTRVDCLIRDETGCVIFIAPNNRGGVVQVTEPAISDVNEDSNLQLL